MIEKILFEYYLNDSRDELFTMTLYKITITNKNVYYILSGFHTLCKEFEHCFKKAGKKNQICLLNDLSEIYKENSEIIIEYE